MVDIVVDNGWLDLRQADVVGCTLRVLQHGISSKRRFCGRSLILICHLLGILGSRMARIRFAERWSMINHYWIYPGFMYVYLN